VRSGRQQRQRTNTYRRRRIVFNGSIKNVEAKFGRLIDGKPYAGTRIELHVREHSWRCQYHRTHDIFNVSGNNVSASAWTLDEGNVGGAIRSVSGLREFLCRWQAGPKLEPVTPTERLLGVQDTAPSSNPLRIARAEAISKPHAVAMIHSSLEQIAQHLDASMRMRPIANAAPAPVPVVINKNEWSDCLPARRRQCTIKQHIAIIDDALPGQEKLQSCGPLHLPSNHWSRIEPKMYSQSQHFTKRLKDDWHGFKFSEWHRVPEHTSSPAPCRVRKPLQALA
jgi:hypothetical protein